MSKNTDSSFWPDFRRFFLRGLATLLPTVLTIVILFKCFEFIQENISVHINEGVIRIVLLTTENYPDWSEDVDEYKAQRNLKEIDESDPEFIKKIRLWKLRRQWEHGPRSLVGFVLAVVLVYILGRLLASFIGHKLWRMFEMAVQQVPGFKQVYPYIKQVTEFLFGENKIEFSRVVAVQYPRKGIWSIGLVTGAGFSHINKTTKDDYITVFIPSSPTPITGYVIHIKKEDAIDLPISIEEALRFTVSGGVIVPGHQELPTQRIELSPAPAIKQDSGEEI